MADAWVNSGGINNNCTTRAETAHKWMAHLAYKTVGKKSRGFEARMWRNSQRIGTQRMFRQIGQQPRVDHSDGGDSGGPEDDLSDEKKVAIKLGVVETKLDSHTPVSDVYRNMYYSYFCNTCIIICVMDSSTI